MIVRPNTDVPVLDGLLPDMTQEGTDVALLLSLRGVDDAVGGVHFYAGKEGDLIGLVVGQVQGTGFVSVEVVLIGKLHDVAKHGAVVHVVTVEQAVAVEKIRLIAAVQKDGAREGKLAEDILVDVLHIVLAPDPRVVNVGVVHRQPGADVRIQFFQLRERQIVRLARGLVLEQVAGGEGPFVGHGRVPEGVPAVQQQQQNQHKGQKTQYSVPNSGSFCGSFQSVSPLVSIFAEGIHPPASARKPGRRGRHAVSDDLSVLIQ